MSNQHCIKEGICSATAKLLQSSDKQDHLMLKEQAMQLLGLAKRSSLFWDEEPMNTGRDLEIRTCLQERKKKKKDKSKSCLCKDFWGLVRLKIKCIVSSHQRVKEYSNKALKIRPIVYKHIHSSMYCWSVKMSFPWTSAYWQISKPSFETDSYALSPSLPTDMLFYF